MPKKRKVVDSIHRFSIVGGVVLLFVDKAVMPSDVVWVTAVGLGLIVVALCLSFRNIE